MTGLRRLGSWHQRLQLSDLPVLDLLIQLSDMFFHMGPMRPICIAFNTCILQTSPIEAIHIGVVLPVGISYLDDVLNGPQSKPRSNVSTSTSSCMRMHLQTIRLGNRFVHVELTSPLPTVIDLLYTSVIRVCVQVTQSPSSLDRKSNTTRNRACYDTSEQVPDDQQPILHLHDRCCAT